MLKLNPIKPNMTEIETDKYKVLFSYQTPVAYSDKQTQKIYETNKKWSRTTTRHIKLWVNHYTTKFVNQFVLDELL